MQIGIHSIGNYKFVVFENKYVTAENNIHTDEAIKENLLYNFNEIQSRYGNNMRAIVQFKRRAHAYKRPDWTDYKFQPEQVSLLPDMGYKVKLPLRDGFGRRVVLEMHYWQETEEGTFYSVHVFGRPSGTIILDTDETVEEFFERFVGEVIYFTNVIKKDYFPFVWEVRSQFNFRPALHVFGW